MGTVTSVTPTEVTVSGSARSFTYNFIQPVVGFVVGDSVRMRDRSTQHWQIGVATSLDPVKVAIDGSDKSFTYAYVELGVHEHIHSRPACAICAIFWRYQMSFVSDGGSRARSGCWRHLSPVHIIKLE